MKSLVVRMTIISDATTWSITYNHHSDKHYIFIMQATAYYVREVIATVKSFIVQVPQTARRNILFYFKVEKNH
jgi:hypothetical protein